MADKMTTEEKAACFDKLHELMENNETDVIIRAVNARKVTTAYIDPWGGHYYVGNTKCDSFMDMLSNLKGG